MKHFFVFDVESVGLHGEGFAVAGGVYQRDGTALLEFCFACDPGDADGRQDDREWVKANVPSIEITNLEPHGVRDAFWKVWLDAKEKFPGIVMAGECLWPVEARFVCSCVDDNSSRRWKGPYPFHEISSFMAAAGMDPMATYERRESEKPAHHPLKDARLSARLLVEALDRLALTSTPGL